MSILHGLLEIEEMRWKLERQSDLHIFNYRELMECTCLTLHYHGDAFGWNYQHVNSVKTLSAAECQKRKLKSRLDCTGSLRKARSNTWLDNSKALDVALGLLYCWVNRISVTAAMTSTRQKYEKEDVGITNHCSIWNSRARDKPGVSRASVW